MRTVTSVSAMQRLALRWRRERGKIGLVPTMGCLHEGHLSLVRRARRLVGPQGKVVVSVFVNPTQFGPAEDFSQYPRDFPRDARLCRIAGADVLFAPATEAMYPRGSRAFSTCVVENTLSKRMEGASRPTHFQGVTTVVTKLFNIVQPDLAVFGAKDFQQAAVVRRMVRDLNFPVRIVVAPTQREPDGLAMSSRNQYLKGDLRPQARVLWRAIQKAKAVARNSPRPIRSSRIKLLIKQLIESAPAARLDYVECFDPDTLVPVPAIQPGTHLALAVFVGTTRLIDNARIC